MTSSPADDGLEVIEDDVPYVKWDKYPMTVDLRVTAVEPGLDYNGEACTTVEGELLKPLDGRDFGEIVRVGGGQTKLRRLITKAGDKIRPGARVVITHPGLIGRMKDFTVAVDPISFAEFSGSPRDDEPAPY